MKTMVGVWWLVGVLGFQTIGAWAQSNRVAKATGPPAFFLQDAQSDGHCLGGEGVFKRCGIETLWYVTGKPGSYSLHRRKVEDEEEDLCLDKTSCNLPESSLRLGHCRHCGAVKWNIVGDSDQGYALTESNGKYCLKREEKKARMTPCEKKEHAALSLQFATRQDIKTMESLGARLVSKAAEGDEKGVRSLLGEVDVNARDWDNLTALTAAAAGGHKKLCQSLLDEFRADPKAVDKDNITALMEAAIGGHTDVAELLLSHAPDLLDATAASGVTALWLAAGEGKLKMAEFLVKKDADVLNARSDGISALMAASSGGHTQVVKLLLEAGADVQISDNEGLTALTNAAENGAADTVSVLLEHGADVDAASNTGFTPLIVAAAGGHTKACEFLLDKGADVHRTHSEGVDALMYAAAGGHAETTKVLLQKGADVKRLHAHGGSALMEAATFGSVEVMELLIEKGADPKIIDKDGVTALMSAASQGKLEATKFLLPYFEASIEDLDRAANSGGTAMMFAAAGGHLETTELLLSKGADVNKLVHGTEDYVLQVAEQLAAGKEDVEPHKEDVTALQVAAQGGHLETVRLLLDSKADIHQKDEEGLSALTNAVAGDHMEVALLLVQRGADPNDAYVDSDAKTRNLLADAVSKSDDVFASLLLEKGASIEADVLVDAARKGLNETLKAAVSNLNPEQLSQASTAGVTPILAAASEGHVLAVETLVTKVSIDSPDEDGTTALMAASVRGHLDTTKVLIQAGANLDAQNSDGHTALMFAYNGKAQVLTLLSKYKSVLASKTAKKDPLQADGLASNTKKPDQDQQDDANLILINQALASHQSILDLLLASGADPNVKDNQGNKAIDFDYKEPRPETSSTTDPSSGPAGGGSQASGEL